MKIHFRILVCSYVDIGPEQALDVSLRSPSEDPAAPLENILQTNSKLFWIVVFKCNSTFSETVALSISLMIILGVFFNEILKLNLKTINEKDHIFGKRKD